MSHAGQRSPEASLGLLDATMVGIGAMIGAGIFVLTGLAADIAGPAAIVAFVLNGGVTTFTALSYAELAAAIPRNGGGYAYVREAFSAPVSFVMGWTRWFTYMIAGALYALGFSSNFVEFFHLYGISLPGSPVVYALAVVVVFVVLNALSTAAAGGAETVITLVKIAILGVFVVFGLSVLTRFQPTVAVDTSEFTPLFSKGTLAVLPAMGLTFIAFQGYDLIATVTEEVENPRKNIPRAILLSVLVTVVIYFLVVFVAIGTLGAEGIAGAAETAIAQAAEGFMPTLPVLGTGAALIAFGAVFSTVSALNAVVIGSSRVAFAMGRERQLPSVLGRLHHRFGTPLVAVAASAVVMLVAVVVVPIRIVGNLASLFSLLGFVVVNLAVIRIRRQQPDLERPFSIPYYPIPPILGIVFNLLLGLFIDPFTWLLALAWLAIGAVTYLALSRRYTQRSGPELTISDPEVDVAVDDAPATGDVAVIDPSDDATTVDDPAAPDGSAPPDDAEPFRVDDPSDTGREGDARRGDEDPAP